MPQLEELLTDELRDIYDAEKQAVKAFPRLARFAKWFARSTWKAGNPANAAPTPDRKFGGPCDASLPSRSPSVHER